jgi:hypothetical protein
MADRLGIAAMPHKPIELEAGMRLNFAWRQIAQGKSACNSVLISLQPATDE